jgi:hypothetical protein
MTNNLTTHLDEALAKQQDNEPLYAILSQYSEESPALRPLLETAAALETLNPVVLPDDATLAADRDIFLTHVANLPPEAVSLGALGRLKGWIAERLPSKSAKLQQKELRPMTPLLIKAALVLSMIFGVTGGAAAFSSASLPDSPLYPLKLTVEEARLALAGDSAARAALHLAFAHERAEEIAQMVQAGKISNEPVQEQLQYHWQNALRLMAQAPEPAMLDLLLQADKLIQQQERTIERIQANAAIAVADPLQSQRALMAQVRLVISLALQDPQTFRQQNGNLFGKAFGENSPGGPNGPGDGVTTGPGSNGFRPGPAGPYGPGDGSCKKIGGCDGYGPGEPQAPGSGEPNGPGPGDPNGPGDGEPNGPGNGDGYGPGPGEPNGPDNNDPHGPGPGDGEPNGPGYGDGYGPGPGVPNDPGNDEPHVANQTDRATEMVTALAQTSPTTPATMTLKVPVPVTGKGMAMAMDQVNPTALVAKIRQVPVTGMGIAMAMETKIRRAPGTGMRIAMAMDQVNPTTLETKIRQVPVPLVLVKATANNSPSAIATITRTAMTTAKTEMTAARTAVTTTRMVATMARVVATTAEMVGAAVVVEMASKPPAPP